jgi:phosphatidylserine/phosphatidylglycerophosphate/cardiolipin synthase-like enzyme
MQCWRWSGSLALIMMTLSGGNAQAQASSLAPSPASQLLQAQGTVEAAFTPWDNIEAMLLAEIARAQHQVLVQAYILTSKPFTRALIQAHQRGVEVSLLIDAGQLNKAGQTCLSLLQSAGVKVALETRYKNAHNKVIVIDAMTEGATVITGSYNFTWSAQNKNAENILILRRNPPLASVYAANWMRHFKDAEPAARQ